MDREGLKSMLEQANQRSRTAKAKELRKAFASGRYNNGILVQAKFNFEAKCICITADMDCMAYIPRDDYRRIVNEDLVDDLMSNDCFISKYDEFEFDDFETLKTLKFIFPTVSRITVYHPNMDAVEGYMAGKSFEIESEYEEITLNEYDAFFYFLVDTKSLTIGNIDDSFGWIIVNGTPIVPIRNRGQEFKEELQESLGGKYLRFFNFNPSRREAYISEIWLDEDKMFLNLLMKTEERIYLNTKDTKYQTVKAIKSFYPNVDKVCALITPFGPDEPASKEDVENLKWKKLEEYDAGPYFYECEPTYVVALKTEEEAHLHAEPGEIESFPWTIPETEIDGFTFRIAD